MAFEIRPMAKGDADELAALSLRKAGFTPLPGEQLFLLLRRDDA